MKKVLLFLLIAFSLGLASCSKQSKAESSVKGFLKNNLDDAKSYESISFSNIDTAWTTFDLSERGQKLSDALEVTQTDVDHSKMDIEADKVYSLSTKKDEDSLSIRLSRYNSAKIEYDKEAGVYPKTQRGWIIDHSFRAKNKIGALILSKKRFVLDNDFKVLVQSDIN